MNKDQNFHLDKSVSIGHLVTTFALVVSAFWFFSDLDKRIQSNEQAIEFIKQTRAEDNDRIEKRLDSIDKKLDKLIAKSANTQ